MADGCDVPGLQALPKQFPGRLQNPTGGSFDFKSLLWSDKAISKGPHKGNIEQEAYIPTDRLEDFKRGEADRAQAGQVALQASNAFSPCDKGI
ncbi:hypothetical protein ABBQ38_014070 [Trebouxia sp. C0009 RCD-2024]